MVCKYYCSQGETHSSLAAEERLIVRSMEPESEIVNKPNLPKCHACKLSFMSKEQLEQHKKDPRYHLVCEQCIIEFHTEEGLRRHKLQIHPTKQNLSCTACKKVFARLGGLIGHIESKECKAISGQAFIQAVQERMVEDTSSLTLANYIKYGQTSAKFNPRSSVAPIANSRHSRPLALEPTYTPSSTISDDKGVNAIPEAASNSRSVTSNIQPSTVMSSWNAAPVEVENHFDPANPAFRASKYYVDIIKKYKCPYSVCIKSFPSKQGFIAHLSSAHPPTEKLRCSNCGRLFINATALTQHCEDELSKCKIRHGAAYAVEVDAFTASVAAVDGHHPDGSVRYVTGLTLAPSTVKAALAAQITAQAEEDERFYSHWEHNRPAW